MDRLNDKSPQITTEQIVKLLKPWALWSSAIESSTITDVTLHLQQSSSSQVVFYRLTNGERALELLKQRIESSNFGLLIITGAWSQDEECGNVIQVSEDGFLLAQQAVADLFYCNNHKMKLVGVTGTNGKTTVVSLAEQISNNLGHAAICAGTIGMFANAIQVEGNFGNTTPSYIDLRKFIHRYQNSYEVLFFELSSHALVQQRVFDLQLDGAMWTSFSQDHLDYHKTMNAYFDAKLMIATHALKADRSLLLPAAEKELIKRVKSCFERVQLCRTLEQWGFGEIPLFFRPDYNRSNLELALQINQELWGQVAPFDLERLKTPDGRFSTMKVGDALVVIDYAHTPEALERVLAAIREGFPERPLSVLFGCGGDRDRTKRPLMGEVAIRLADRVYITSDNPRSEDPQSIIDEIICQIDSQRDSVFVEVDRTNSIIDALGRLRPQELLLIAGKGHEQYQEIAGEKFQFSDFEVVKKFNQKQGEGS
ncbi:MAG: UDP-N-acetylmuramoyl-L-alanyl-D-glutamate--2,6-diaminopimelate ligase [Bdellovibrionales bacterium]|nr:UDP-N-acetylmuramoyl-L-alanyl-D-glutamate--2,6-diaminopimelate ligase [Bdellovibrionales bacterium]MBT3526044.1 UDP-N-acetylmuramoyl-L-alanyl-D-glutamate--2,6-diaminopimelate ligase [Bdellovibrionales bacterium]MBT7668694.1 UDP-N-acetylmuramoyl-L-alanyl-D-glutamate--2,6-diaminopimelate ligase [Bdellovibrionales bacterium]